MKNNLCKKKKGKRRSLAAFELIDQSISPRRAIAREKKEKEKIEIILQVWPKDIGWSMRRLNGRVTRQTASFNLNRAAIEFQTAASCK